MQFDGVHLSEFDWDPVERAVQSGLVVLEMVRVVNVLSGGISVLGDLRKKVLEFAGIPVLTVGSEATDTLHSLFGRAVKHILTLFINFY